MLQSAASWPISVEGLVEVNSSTPSVSAVVSAAPSALTTDIIAPVDQRQIDQQIRTRREICNHGVLWLKLETGEAIVSLLNLVYLQPFWMVGWSEAGKFSHSFPAIIV